ncbi:hypothetical protein KSP39_PZI005009 [Platanthera zijinensis]|uniref:Uncharacterized protein n=1 Tax=Platanthera zijinensis TaxID=2320716 RepID=A0AAP0BSU5_9ASPA
MLRQFTAWKGRRLAFRVENQLVQNGNLGDPTILGSNQPESINHVFRSCRFMEKIPAKCSRMGILLNVGTCKEPIDQASSDSPISPTPSLEELIVALASSDEERMHQMEERQAQALRLCLVWRFAPAEGEEGAFWNQKGKAARLVHARKETSNPTYSLSEACSRGIERLRPLPGGQPAMPADESLGGETPSG